MLSSAAVVIAHTSDTALTRYQSMEQMPGPSSRPEAPPPYQPHDAARADKYDAEGAVAGAMAGGAALATSPPGTHLSARPLRSDVIGMTRLPITPWYEQHPLDLAASDVAEAAIAEILPDPRAKPSSYTSASDRVSDLFCRQLLNRLSAANQKAWVRSRPKISEKGICFFNHFATILHTAKTVGVPEKKLAQFANQWARYALCGNEPAALDAESQFSFLHFKRASRVAADVAISLMQEIAAQVGEVPGHSLDVVEGYASEHHDTLIRKAIDIMIDRTADGPSPLRCKLGQNFGDAHDIINALQSDNHRHNPVGAQEWRKNMTHSMHRLLKTTALLDCLAVASPASAPLEYLGRQNAWALSNPGLAARGPYPH